MSNQFTYLPNSKMTLPLFELFQTLREPLSLQLEQYFLLLEAIQKGRGCRNINELKITCRLLWLKSVDSEAEKKFDNQFDLYFENYQERQSLNEEKSDEISAVSQKKSQETQEKSSDKKGSKLVSNKPIAPQRTQSQSSTRLPIAYQTAPPIDITESQQGYILKVSDFPFLERQTRHSWLKLRQPLRKGQTPEIDIQATVQTIGRDGICLKPKYKSQRLNKTELLFLQDIDGSMIPFRPIIDRLFNTIEPKYFTAVNRYYFRNCPRDFVYLQPKETEILSLDSLPLKPEYTVLVIISDAGAARGGYNPMRVEMTKVLLNKLEPFVKALFWLNPIPSQRWSQTTAQVIYQLLEGKMFELPEGGIQVAINQAQKG